METQELFRLALKSLIVNKLRSILTTLGIIIGVFSIILLVSLGSGLQSYITGQISALGSNLLYVIPGQLGGGRGPGGIVPNKLVPSDATLLSQRLKDIANVAPAVSKGAKIKYKNKIDNTAMIYGTSANFTQVVKFVVNRGTIFSPGQERSGTRVVVVGQTVVDQLYSGENPIGKTLTIGNSRYLIIGTFEKRGSTFGIDQDNIVMMPIPAALKQLGLINISTIYMVAKSPELVPLVKTRATTLLLHRLTADDFTIQTQESTLSTITSITNVLSIALGGIAAISLLVGGIGVANIMLVSVTERTKEIGLRKALGAQRKDILYQFLLEAIILSVGGGLIGIALGMGASMIIAAIFVSSVTPWSVFLAFFFSVAVGVIFGMAPAIKASKLSPIEALRHE